MIAFICLFFPAVVSVCFYEKLSRKDLARKQWIYCYAAYVLMINFSCFFMKSIIRNSGDLPMFDLYHDMLPFDAMKYLIIAVPFVVAIPVVQALLSKHIQITVEEDSNAENK